MNAVSRSSFFLLAAFLLWMPNMAFAENEMPEGDLPEGDLLANEEQLPPLIQIAFFDLYPKNGVTKKQARGISLMLREQLKKIGVIELKEKRKDDKRTRRKCHKKPRIEQPKCLGKAAFSRGADLLLTGTLHTADTGFFIHLEVILQREIEVDREVEGAFGGSNMESTLNRLLREAVAPATLTGSLEVKGAPMGATVLIDGKLAGTLPLNRIEALLEGEYTLDIEKEGYTPATRRVKIHYKELTQLQVTLIPTSFARKEQDRIAEGREKESNAWLFAIPATLGGASLAAAASGIAFGYFALQEQKDATARAQANMLLFPDDAEILERGQAFALASNLSYVAAGVLLTVAAGTIGFLLLPEQIEEEELEAFSATGKKDYDDAEMQPALEGL